MTDLEKILLAALEQADLFINSYCVCKPSRIQAVTRATVEDAIGKAKAAMDVEGLLIANVCICCGRHTCTAHRGLVVTVRED
jgi:hypothetical protein